MLKTLLLPQLPTDRRGSAGLVAFVHALNAKGKATTYCSAVRGLCRRNSFSGLQLRGTAQHAYVVSGTTREHGVMDVETVSSFRGKGSANSGAGSRQRWQNYDIVYAAVIMPSLSRRLCQVKALRFNILACLLADRLQVGEVVSTIPSKEVS